MANTYAGEIGVTMGGREYLFRPSLSAMATLGTPEEIVEFLVRIQSPGIDGFLSALSILSASYVGDCDDLDRLMGYLKDVNGRLRYVAGAMPQNEIHILGARLSVSGMIGDPKGARGKGKSATRFDPAEYVGTAQAHLGLSAAEAWHMTMVELQRALDAKFPSEDKEDELTTEEAQAAVDHVRKMRARMAVH